RSSRGTRNGSDAQGRGTRRTPPRAPGPRRPMMALEALRQSPALLAALAALLGLMVGSFLNVVIYRLPRIMERQWRAECAELTGSPPPPAERFNLVVPRSACPSCGRAIRALENIPVASYLALRGRCAGCRAPIS